MGRINPKKFSFLLTLAGLALANLEASVIIDHTYIVSKTTDSGLEGELRWAIRQSNSNPPGESKTNQILFQIPGTGPFAIYPQTDLDAITQAVIIDGYSQSGAEVNLSPQSIESTLQIEISGNASKNQNGFVLSGIQAPGASIIGFAIGGFGASGITIDASELCKIEGNQIGTDISGNIHPNPSGIKIINGSQHCEIGGSNPAEKNLIAGSSNSGAGIWISDSSHICVRGNLIGTDRAGLLKLQSSQQGIYIQESSFITVGGMNAADRNVISGHSRNGIQLKGNVSECVILGNYIGVDTTGAQLLGNGLNGIELLGSGTLFSNTRNVIGGIESGEANVLSGNGNAGIRLGHPKFQGVNQNDVLGNLIGTDATGALKLGNNYCGIEIYDNENTIGGLPFNERNIISGNAGNGIILLEHASNNHIIGNYIGTDIEGLHALGNDGNGIQIGEHGRHGFSNGNVVEGNVISSNLLYGILIQSTSCRNVIQNNIFGKNAFSRGALPNRKGNSLCSANNTYSNNDE